MLGSAVGRRAALDIALPAGRPVSLTDQVVAAIRAAAERGEIRPGQLYSAYQLAELLDVSRAPVREALMKLSEAGMVRMERNRGFRLVVPDAREIAEIFQLRLLLEVPAARAAAGDATGATARELRREFRSMRAAVRTGDADLFMAHDRAFHDCALRSTGNRRLVLTVGALRDATRTLGASTVDRSRGLADIAAEHEPILTAVRDRDPEAAAEAMRVHVTRTGRLLVEQAADDPDEAERLWHEIVGAA